MKKGILKVKNAKTYVYVPEPNPGGDKKDFCYGNDVEFAEHKANLIRKTSEIADEVGNRDVSNFATMVVKLKEDALAKSHRPTNALFNDKYPVIGGGDIGELYVQVNSKSLPHLAERIAQAKVESDVKIDQNGNAKPKVGALRSEVSAIEGVELFENKRKCRQSNADLFKCILAGKRELIIELFSPAENKTLNDSEINELKSSLILFVENSLEDLGSLGSSEYFSDSILSLKFSKGLTDGNYFSAFVDRLKAHPVVKSIYPAPEISFSDSHSQQEQLVSTFPQPSPGATYPKVALIDCGVRSPLLKSWVTEASDALGDEEISEYHADEMASLLIGSRHLNNLPELEKDGCEIYDIWIPATIESFDEQFDGFDSFSDWLYLEVQAARELGFRIFSMSINFVAHGEEDSYGLLASRFDQISYTFGVIFVLSVGNLRASTLRPEWPKEDAEVFKMLARHKSSDRILEPSECVSAISVGAINHIQNKLVSKGVPTRYTLRGPSVAYGLKPDITHYGGVADASCSGIRTIDGDSQLVGTSFGTSLAAPHVAKTLACIDYVSNQELSPVSLKALVIHNSQIPDEMQSKELQKETREFLGHGVPEPSSQIVENEEHSFTFVFSEHLKRGQVADFNFTWPSSLVTSLGKCKGAVKMTLVYQPPIDKDFGSEYVRANVEASLQQEKFKNGQFTFKKEVDSIWKTQLGEDATLEKNLIEHGFKWWPTKVYQRISKSGFGESSNWRLRVKSQVRDGEIYPEEGIEFAVVITVEDHTGVATNVYQEMYSSLKSIGVDIDEVQVTEEVRV
ncbi:S8 family serine peptidase [Alteromonas portus]|uniref:S8 family serine peptidase n=1 Tax=Alteromonas portus TaxID=2565549 RepID=UPI003BF85364